MKLDAENAVSEVDQRRARALFDAALPPLDLGQRDDTRALFQETIASRLQIEVLSMRLAVRIRGQVEGFSARREHVANVLGQRKALLLDATRGLLKTEGVPQLEWT